MTIISKISIVVVVVVGLFAGFVQPIFALKLETQIYRELGTSAGETYVTQATRPGALIRTVRQATTIIIGVLGVAAVIMILYAGFIWLTAGGSEEKVGKAKKIIKQAVIGLIIISFAYGIVGFVFRAVPTTPADVESEEDTEQSDDK